MTLNIDVLIRDIKIRKKIWTTTFERSSSPLRPTDGIHATLKSTVLANKSRNDGNNFYKMKQFKDAKLLYTLSIAHALEDSEELYKAYGNRSAVLFELHQYASCLLDINRALNCHDCPNLLRQKLLDRKKRCLTLMKSSTEDEIDEDATNPPTDQEPSWRVNMLSQFSNPLLPNASPKIELKYNEKWGRHFVANADIETGEILMSENYFLTVLLSIESCCTCCDFCMKVCDALISCPSCARVMYCSDRCRIQAYDSYHRTECKLFLLGFCDSLNESFAIRMFLIGTEQGKALENLMNTLSIADIFVEDFDFSGKPARSDYLTALRMTMRGAFNERKVISNIKMAVENVIGLRKSSFFENVPADRLEETELFSIALLLNNFSSDRYKNRINSVGSSRSKIDRGYGQMVLGYFLNHSCFPNAFRHLLHRRSVLYAVRPIKKNEQIFVAYVDDCVIAPKAERIEQLDFTCRCVACSNDWPSYMEDFSAVTLERDLPLIILQDMLPHNNTERATLSEITDVVAPLLNDTTLINLRTYEISRILAKTISLLYKVMKPISFPIVELRRFLHRFLDLHYKERESDPEQNKKLKFLKPGLGFHNIMNTSLLANFGATTITTSDMLLSLRATSAMIDIIDRLRTYESEGRFIKQKMIR